MITFSERQQKTVARGLTVLSVALVVAFAVFVGWLALKALALASPAITPVVLGMFLAMFLRPYYHWWRRLVRNPTLALLLLALTILVPAGLLLWYFGAFAAEQVSNLIEQAPQLMAKLHDWAHATFPKARALADNLGVPYESWFEVYKVKAAQAGVQALGCVKGVLNGIVALLFFVLFLTQPDIRGRDCVKELPFLKDETKAFVSEQIDAFLGIVVTFFQCQTMICLIEGLYYGLGFALVGLPYGFLIGFALGAVNLIPLVGTAIFLPMALAVAYFAPGGSLALVLLTTGVWAVGQVLDGYLITPKIQGKKMGLGYAGVIFSFFFWGTVLHSVLGLLLAIPLSAFCVVLWRALKSKYIRPVV